MFHVKHFLRVISLGVKVRGDLRYGITCDGRRLDGYDM